MPDSLGDRMKGYEGLPESTLMPRTPVVIRVDGKAFHTLTRSMERPWDDRLVKCMWETAQHLAEHIAGCKLAYVQSDEISLLLTDWDTYNTQPWFVYRVQKATSIAASMTTAAFTRAFLREFDGTKFTTRLPMFDARMWNVPQHEVNNYFLWRQQDASRNSVQMLARAHFSHSECHKKNNAHLQEMLFSKHGINWNDTPTAMKRGACVVKDAEGGWKLDTEIPIFSQDRTYIEGRMPEMFWKETST